MGIFDDEQLPGECPNCGRDFQRTLGEVKRQPKFACPGCGADVDATDLADGLDDVDEGFDDLMDALD